MLFIEKKNVNFSTQFSLGSISNGFSAIESRKVSWNGNMYDFWIDYNSINNSDILSIHEYLIAKSNKKQYLALWKKCLLYY